MPRLAVAAIAIFSLTACGGSGDHPPPARPRPASAPAQATTATQAAPKTQTVPRPHRVRHRHATNPGRLPQTMELPSDTSGGFRIRIRRLWRAVVLGAPRAARQAFFPLLAYEQVKAIGDPAADWNGRLLGDFALDIQAAHRLVGAGARLLRVLVPSGHAHWVPPGACYNRVGYYEVPNSRMVYTSAGQERSFGIASMISWRGQWYVIHLGAILRPAVVGMVDDPAIGVGVPAPSSTC